MDSITTDILQYLQSSAPKSVSCEELTELLSGDLPGIHQPRKAIGTRLGALKRAGLAVQKPDGLWAAAVVVKKEVSLSLRPYVAERHGVDLTVYVDPQEYKQVVALEFSPDGTVFFPVHLEGASRVHIGKEVPDWGLEMDIYRNICAYRLFLRQKGEIKSTTENLQGLGWNLVVTGGNRE